jgi:misacylated tRNA(Ala) deacylase
MYGIEGNYIKEFDAVVVKNNKEYVCLDETVFYPLGGGQPSDVGFLKWENNVAEVKEVIKKGDTIEHIIVGEKPPEGTKIHGIIDWNKRYAHMKMHTAQHILSGIVFDDYKGRTVGNQIHADYSRIDFQPVTFSDKNLEDITNKFNDIIKKTCQLRYMRKSGRA